MAQVGFVGVGRMGANMARRLHDKGYRITAVHDRNHDLAQTLARELRCVATERAAGVAELSDTIVTVVSDDDAMRELYAEGDSRGLLLHAEGRLFLNCATITPSVHAEVEQAVERHGGASLEACMASSITQARQGTLYLMCGGKPDVFARAKPLLEALGSTIRYIGPAGEAAKVKALVNMVMNCNTAALAEGLGLGDALGLDLTVLREVFSQTGAA
ncbi:MAG TPA: NAD(P)-binding domain-containing protein, partial [Nitrospira sp.]|nr:NAD(P)-binding domain-containing protein [Nitrospira sp.]